MTGQRRRERAQAARDARRLGHSCVYFSFFFIFLTNKCFIVCSGCRNSKKRQKGMTRARDRRVLSLVLVCSFFFLSCLIISKFKFISTSYVYGIEKNSRQAINSKQTRLQTSNRPPMPTIIPTPR